MSHLLLMTFLKIHTLDQNVNELAFELSRMQMKPTKVIWYLSKRNRWCITPSEQIGSWSCSIHSKNYGDFDPWNIPRGKWSYNGVETESDFAVECSGNGRTDGQSN